MNAIIRNSHAKAPAAGASIRPDGRRGIKFNILNSIRPHGRRPYSGGRSGYGRKAPLARLEGAARRPRRNQKGKKLHKISAKVAQQSPLRLAGWGIDGARTLGLYNFPASRLRPMVRGRLRPHGAGRHKADFRNAVLAENADFLRGGAGEINDPPVDEGPAIIDAHGRAFPAVAALDAHARIEGQGEMRGGERLRRIGLAIGGKPAGEGAVIIGGDAAFRLEARRRGDDTGRGSGGARAIAGTGGGQRQNKRQDERRRERRGEQLHGAIIIALWRPRERLCGLGAAFFRFRRPGEHQRRGEGGKKTGCGVHGKRSPVSCCRHTLTRSAYCML